MENIHDLSLSLSTVSSSERPLTAPLIKESIINFYIDVKRNYLCRTKYKISFNDCSEPRNTFRTHSDSELVFSPFQNLNNKDQNNSTITQPRFIKKSKYNWFKFNLSSTTLPHETEEEKSCILL